MSEVIRRENFHSFSLSLSLSLIHLSVVSTSFYTNIVNSNSIVEKILTDLESTQLCTHCISFWRLASSTIALKPNREASPSPESRGSMTVYCLSKS